MKRLWQYPMYFFLACMGLVIVAVGYEAFKITVESMATAELYDELVGDWEATYEDASKCTLQLRNGNSGIFTLTEGNPPVTRTAVIAEWYLDGANLMLVMLDRNRVEHRVQWVIIRHTASMFKVMDISVVPPKEFVWTRRDTSIQGDG